ESLVSNSALAHSPPVLRPRFPTYTDSSLFLAFLARRPPQRILDQPLVSRMLVRRPVVTQRDPYDARVRMLDDEDHWEGLVFRWGVGGGKHLNRRAVRVGLEPVELILETEFGRQAPHQRMVRFRDCHFKFAITIVA